MTHISANSFAALYKEAMTKVFNAPDFETSPRGLKIRECMNVCMELTDPENNLYLADDKSITLQTGYLKRELCLYLNGCNSAEMFAKASKFWNFIKNDDNTINSAYGYLIFKQKTQCGYTQFDWAFESLKKDKDSRQAILHFNNPTHQYDGVKDFPCTVFGNFHIRDNKLNFTIVMRSNDIRKGLQYDLPFFTLVQKLMLIRLRDIYPDLQMGVYTHISQSLHIYESDFEYAQKIIDSDLAENRLPDVSNWRVILSDDIDKVKNRKFSDSQLEIQFDLDENLDFYTWLIS